MADGGISDGALSAASNGAGGGASAGGPLGAAGGGGSASPVAGGSPAGIAGAPGSGTGASPSKSTSAPRPGAPIKIGVWSLDGAQTTALLNAFGYEGRPFDDHQMIEAVFDDMNARGGLLGHRVEPVIYNQDVLNQEASGQQACAMFTQDNKVLGLGIWSPMTSSTLLECIRQNQLPTSINQSGAVPYFDTEDFVRHPTIQISDGIAWDREADVFVAQLVAMNFFSGWDVNTGRPGAAPVRVGIIADDLAGARKVVSKHLIPALSRHGHKVEAQAYITGAGTGWSTVVLQMKQQGITHILPVYGSPASQLYPTAESQQYRPRYAFDSKAWPYALTAGAAPASQLRGIVGIGWQASRDVPGADWPAPNAQQRRCEQVMSAAGVDTRDQLGRFASMLICDMGWGLQASFEAGGALTPQAFIEGRKRLGSSFVTAMTYKTDFRAGRADAVAAIRRFAYREDCDCFKYTSGLIDV